MQDKVIHLFIAKFVLVQKSSVLSMVIFFSLVSHLWVKPEPVVLHNSDSDLFHQMLGKDEISLNFN